MITTEWKSVAYGVPVMVICNDAQGEEVHRFENVDTVSFTEKLFMVKYTDNTISVYKFNFEGFYTLAQDD